MSKGCAEPCPYEPKHSTEKMNELGWLVNEGAILAISSDLLTEIKETCDKSQFTRHSELTIAVLTSAEKSGRLWIIDDLPVFVSEGIATDSFAVVGRVVIQIFEAESSKQWYEYLRLGSFQATGNRVSVRRFTDVNRDMIVQKRTIKQGASWNGVRKLLEVPIIWSRRIILYDQYALKNSRASRLPNRGDISGLDRFLQCLVETRRENNLPPLDELTIISHPSVSRTDSEKKSMLKMDPNLDIDDITKHITPDEQIEAMKEICHQHALHDWVGDVKLLFTKSRSEGNRFIVFESDGGQQIFEFGTKGLASIDSENIGDPIEEQFTIKGPLEKQEWQPFKDKLKTFKEHVIESTI